jgi:2-keto-4-pentenoate hydratase
MMTPDRASEAAEAIWQHWQDGAAMQALPEHVRPADRRSGYAIQARVVARSLRQATGWKIAATSKSGQSHIGVDGPLAGRLLGERTSPSGAELSLVGNRMRVAEPEFAFRFARRLDARPEAYEVSEVLAAVDSVLPALEIPDSRFADFATAGGPQLIADLACAHQIVLGKPTMASWRDIDLAAHPVEGTIVGGLSRTGSGANVLGDPRIALTWLVNEISALGLSIEPGEVVTTGTCMQPIALQPGDHVRADFGPLGSVEARFA